MIWIDYNKRPQVWLCMKQNWNHHTGAIYSSVPTNEFDCVIGSATSIGGGSLRDFLLLPGNACFTTCKN